MNREYKVLNVHVDPCYHFNLLWIGKKILSNTEKLYIFGRHAVESFLSECPHMVLQVWLDERKYNSKHADWCRSKLVETGSLKMLTPAVLNQLGGGVQTQGWVARVVLPIYQAKELPELLADERSCLVLDHLHDPHNVGACIRSACAFGVRTVLIPKHGACPINATVAKVAAGALAHVRIVTGNISMLIKQLKNHGFWVVSTSERGDKVLGEDVFPTPTAWVMGNEEKGVSEMILRHSDACFRLPTSADFPSLNVSVATGIVLMQGHSENT